MAFHRAWFVPNNALLAIVGDLTADEAFAAAEKAFGSWQRRDVPVVKPPDPPAPKRRVVVIDRPGSAQTEIRVGHLAIPRTHPEFVPMDLAVRILGGEGAVQRTVIGCLFVALVANGFNLLGLDPFYQQVTLGVILLLAVGLDAWSRRAD